MCDYIMIISKGKLVASDTPEHLEELMNGSDTIHIETRAEEETVREILSGLKDIEDVTYTQENEILKAEVKTKERKDIREAYFQCICRGTMSSSHIAEDNSFVGRSILRIDRRNKIR